ncbi:MAG: response regulator transcription factor [Caldilineaceae bacterium]|nr:response regulator transcription factor [Caldilineaceae bacterium]
MSQVRLLLADDHRMFRQGLRELIERKTPFEVIGEARTGLEVLEQVDRLRPDILLLDIQMPDLDGIAVARQLATSHPHIKIVMLTMYREDQHLLDAIKAGVKGYLLKDADAEELLTVIGQVAQGESALDPALTARIFEAVRRPVERDLVGALSERELDILRLVAAGHDNRTIASQLHLSEKTVGNRLSDIFQKLHVTNRTQAALVAVQRGLVSPKAPDIGAST